ncbi:MAG: ATP-binding protein [Bacteroidia bacterium]|nr:ATP-binding protein [Bacteroidia bacterium]
MNQFLWIVGICCLCLFGVIQIANPNMIVGLVITSLIVVVTLTANKFKRFKFARYFVFISLPAWLALLVVFAIGSSGEDLTFAAFIIAAYFLYSENKGFVIFVSAYVSVIAVFTKIYLVLYGTVLQGLTNPYDEIFITPCVLIIIVLIIVAYQREITYYKAQQQQLLSDLEAKNKDLEERNEELSHFTYITSHDLKEPIRNISSFTALIERKLTKETPAHSYRQYFQYINVAIDTLLGFVNSLKVFSEVSGEERVLHQPVYFEDGYGQVLFNLHELIQERTAQVTFENELENGLTYQCFSREYLILLLQNLIENGIIHNDSEVPIIRVALVKQEGSFLITVADNGKGIPQEYLSHIFEPFKTLHSKSLTQSSGLGLAICRKIVAKIHADIWVESTVEQGSCFFIRLHEREAIVAKPERIIRILSGALSKK